MRKRPSWFLPIGVDIALVAVALADSLVSLYWADPWQTTIAVVGSLGLLLRRRWPWASFLLALPSFALSAAALALLFALYAVAVADPKRWRVFAAGGLTLASSAEVRFAWETPNEFVLSVIYAIMTAAAPVALGLLVRTRHELSARVRDLDAARESERQHVEEDVLTIERARIAREMHDVVSHQVSLIAVQAGALQVATPDSSTKETARTIRRLATRTLDELRQMVAVLRASGSPAAQLAPQPTINDINALVAGSGIPAALTLDLPGELPASVQRAIYRTIQEALTNVRKHAPGGTSTISAVSHAGMIDVVVHNTAGTGQRMEFPSSGHGLIGLRERAELLDGSLTTGAAPDGSFTLTLRLPI